MGIAYRMLGSRADAEDVLQEAWLRWNESDTDSLRSAEAWLVTVTTRLSIDRLRQLRTEREHYPGFWLAEPVVEPAGEDTPETLLEHAGEVSMALLQVLEQLGPDERAAFILRQAFELDYARLVSDGGGKVPSFGHVLRGSLRLAGLYYAAFRRLGTVVRYEVVRVNGRPGMVRIVDGRLESAHACEVAGDRIALIHVQRNPDKLTRAAAVTNAKAQAS